MGKLAIKILWFRQTFLRRFLSRLKFLFRLKEMWSWQYESCNRCGCCYRIPTDWVDNKWIEVVGSKNGCLCAECFIKIAQQKRINIKKQDIELMWLFDPDDCCGGYMALIGDFRK